MFKKSLIGIILFGVVAIFLLQIDDDLNPEVAAFLEQAEPAEQSEAYLYLLGIVAAEGEDPLKVGKQLFADMQQAERDYQLGDESFGYEGYPEENKLALPEGKYFCGSRDEQCWPTLFSNPSEIDQVIRDHATLLERYQSLVQLMDYRSLSKPTSLETFPPFDYLLKANRLVVLNTIYMAHIAEPAQAVEMLVRHVAELRRQLIKVDNVIGKVIYSALIAESIDVLSLIVHKNNLVFKDEISPISSLERDFSTIMAREFAMNFDLFMSMDRHPDFFAKSLNGDYKSPHWLVRAVFKPNMTVNDSLSFYKSTIARSQLEQTEFSLAMADEMGGRDQLSKFSIRNYAGNILNEIAVPNFDQYIASIFDLNAKIAIFNQTVNKAELSADLKYIQNPYYESGGTAYYIEDGKTICLTGPLGKDQNHRCLKVKL
jgi:hypothetical protein